MTTIKFFLAHMNHQARVGNTKMHPLYVSSCHYLVGLSDQITIKVGLITFLVNVKHSPGIYALV